MRPSERLVLLLLGLLVPCLGGCVEVEEELALDSRGGGLYDLKVTWDQALLGRVVGAAGATASNRLRGRDLPLEIEAWRDSLKGLEGLEARHTEVRALEGGARRILQVQVAFRRLEDLLRWEPFARRSIRVTRPEAHRAVLTMDPLARIPYLDPLAEALRRIDATEETGGTGLGVLDPSPRERLGLSSRALSEARALLEPALADVKLVFRVRTPGLVTKVGTDGRVDGDDREAARFELDFARIQKHAPRVLELTWRPNSRDRVPTLSHEGDRAPSSPGEGSLR